MGNTNIHAEWWLTDGLVGRDTAIRAQFAEALIARDIYGDFDHFTGDSQRYVSTIAYAGYTTTIVGASTLVKLDEIGGVLQLLTSVVEDQGVNMQTDGEFYLPAATKDIWFEAKIRTDEATENDLFVGLCTTDTTIIASNPADVIGFWTHDGDANLDFEVSATAGGGAPVDTLTDLVDAAWIRVGFWVQGLTQVVPYINGVANATATGVTVANIPAVEMAPAIAILTGEAGIHSLDIDYIRIAQLV